MEAFEERAIRDFGAWLTDGAGGQYLRIHLYPEAGLWTGAQRLLFHYTLHLGMIGDYAGYADRWCYPTREAVFKALAAWDAGAGGEPEGSHKHPDTGRLRPDCDPAREWIEGDLRAGLERLP